MGIKYVIYAIYSETDKYYYINQCSRTIELDNIKDDELNYLIDQFGFTPCFNAEVKNDLQKGCTREYNPVCGCDEITYGNLCEAKSNGIMIYRRGICQ